MVTWTDIYRSERDGLVRLAYLMTGSQSVAEDLVQDTFIRVMAHIGPEATPAPYLRRSVINACYSWHRRAWREVRTGDGDRLGADGPSNGPDGGHRRGDRRTDRRADRRAAGTERPDGSDGEADVEMWDALNRLAPRRRAILVMRYYLDMTEADVADVLGCRVGTVKSTSHRALAELRKMIER